MKDNKKIHVSVIIPTWNRAHMLKNAIQSALNQSLVPSEIIVSDDGSTDNTFETIKSLNNPKVKLVAGKHSGLPAAVRNRGIKESRGDWLAFLDSDDEWYPRKLEKQLESVRNTDCLAVSCNAYSVNTKKNKKIYLDYSNRMITFFDLIKVNYVITSSAVIHRSLIPKCLGFPETQNLKTGQDYAFWLRVLTQTNFLYINESLVNYCDEPNNSIRRFTKNPYLQKKIILEDFLKWGWKNKIRLKYLQMAFIYYLKSIKDLIRTLH